MKRSTAVIWFVSVVFAAALGYGFGYHSGIQAESAAYFFRAASDIVPIATALKEKRYEAAGKLVDNRLHFVVSSVHAMHGWSIRNFTPDTVQLIEKSIADYEARYDRIPSA